MASPESSANQFYQNTMWQLVCAPGDTVQEFIDKMPGCLGVDDPILYLDGVYYHMGSIVDEQMKQAVDGGQTFGIVTSMDILVAVHNHPEMKAQVLVHKGSTTFDEFKMLCERELCSGIPIVGLMVGGCEITEMSQKMFARLEASDTIEVVVKDLNNAT